MAKRVELAKSKRPDVNTLLSASPVRVVDSKPGPVSWLDRLKGYYHGLIAAAASLLVVLNEVSPVLNFLPGNLKHYFDVLVVVVGAALTFLKSNEVWVDGL